MTAITTATLYSEPNTLTYDILNTRSYITDPKDATGARTFVYDSEPFAKAVDFGKFPYIFLKLPVLDQEQNSADSKHHMLTYTQSIIVRTCRDGSGGSRTDSGKSNMKSICDDMFETFNKATVKQLYRTSQLFKPILKLLNSDSGLINQKAIYETEFEISFETRFKVSS